MNKRPSLVFVCLGNTCRSPAAQGLFKAYDKHNEFDVQSRGTSAYPEKKPPSQKMLQVASKEGIYLDSLSKLWKYDDFLYFDYIFVADSSVANTLLVQLKKGKGDESLKEKIKAYSYFSHSSFPNDILDPYYGTGKDYEKVFALLKRLTKDIYTALRVQ